MDGQLFVTVPEAMTALRLGRAKVYDLIRSNDLPSVKIGRSRRIPVDALAAFVNRIVEEQS